MANRAFLVGGLKAAQTIITNPVFVYKDDGGKVFDPATDYSLLSRSHLKWDYDFSGGWNSRQRQGDVSTRTLTAIEWMQSQMQGPEACTIVDDPAGGSGKVARMHWIKALVPTPATNVSKKAYLWCYKEPNDTTECWYGWSMYLPSDGLGSDPGGSILVQWHGHPDSGEAYRNPPLSINLKDGTLRVSWIYDERKITPKDPAERGFEEGVRRTTVNLGAPEYDTWLHCVAHIAWSPESATGTLEMWVNGDKVIDEVGNCQIGFNDSIGTYLGIGLYQYEVTAVAADTRTVYFGNNYIGNASATYADVYTGAEP